MTIIWKNAKEFESQFSLIISLIRSTCFLYADLSHILSFVEFITRQAFCEYFLPPTPTIGTQLGSQHIMREPRVLSGAALYAPLTLQEKWWCTARLSACFLSATRVAEHFSQHATFRSAALPGAGLAAMAEEGEHELEKEEDAALLRRLPGRDLYAWTASGPLWHMFRSAAPLVARPPSGPRRTSGCRSCQSLLDSLRCCCAPAT